MPGTPSAPWVLGPFTLHGEDRRLLLGGVRVEMPGEQFDVLAMLASRAPSSVPAERLLARLAPGMQDGAHLWYVVSGINEVLRTGSAAHYVAQTGPTQYQLIGPVDCGTGHGHQNLQPAARGDGGLPAHARPVVGRAAAIARLQAQLAADRLVTVTGAGGMGKTTVALAVAAALASGFGHGACLVDLAPLAHADALPQAVAVGLGVELGDTDALQALGDFLQGRQMLLVLDNCEHLVSAVASLVEHLLAQPGLRILCTSREPLRARGEQVYQLQPMEVPQASDAITAQQAARHSAVQMFVQVARSESDGFLLSDANAAAVSAICRRLDGIPLALELAAAHVATLGVERLAAQLPDTMLTLPLASRSLEDRHRTLEATLDWSHSLLNAAEQAVLRRISVFRSTFPLDSAVRVAADDAFSEVCVVDALLGLAAKSLVHLSGHGQGIEYRLLDATRTYAACKLQAAPELPATRYRYAQDCCERLQAAESLWPSMQAPAWMQRHGHLIQDVRCGLDWAVGAPGTERLALRLLLASLPLAGRMSLLEEYSERIGQGLERLRAGGDPDPVLELQLSSALTALMLNQNLPVQAIEAMSDRVLALAAALGDDRFGAVAGTALWMSSLIRGDYPRASRAAHEQLVWAQRQGDASLLMDAQRQVAYCHHYIGQQAQAALCAERLLALAPPPAEFQVHTVNQIDHRVAMRIVLARAQWITGCPATALLTIRAAIALAECDRPTALCQALAFGGCQIALWNGEHALAREWTQRLDGFAGANRLPFYQHWAAHYGAVLERREGRPADPAALAPLTPMQHDAFATLDPLWAGTEAYARVEQGLVGWCAAEVVRAQGERQLLGGQPAWRAAQQFQRAIGLAREQGALAWELRAATSLARLACGEGALDQARQWLEPVLHKFGEGGETRDLREASEILDQCRY